MDLEKQEGRRLLLSLCKDVALGLAHLHNTNAIPEDLGARTCQITGELIVKIGDYGLAKSSHPEDYLSADPATTSNHSLAQSGIDGGQNLHLFQPLRWLSPETLDRILKEGGCGSGLFVKQDRKESIWSLGITLWEMCYLCQKQPFDQIADHQFLRASLIHSDLTLLPIPIKVSMQYNLNFRAVTT